jgi:maltose alpha-D-glucosyltransferase / alpha-amylase
VHNFEPEARDVSLRVGGEPLADAMDVEQVAPDGRGIHHVRIEPYGYRWFRAGVLNQALRREPVGGRGRATPAILAPLRGCSSVG